MLNVREYLSGDQTGYHDRANPGLIYCRARYYDPGNARWISRDPIGYDGGLSFDVAIAVTSTVFTASVREPAMVTVRLPSHESAVTLRDTYEYNSIVV